MLEANQAVNAREQEGALSAEFEDTNRVVSRVVQAHKDTCSFTRDNIRNFEQKASDNPVYATSGQLFCPVNQRGQQSSEQNLNAKLGSAIGGVVEFGKRLPGFRQLNKDDQTTLLKASVHDVLLFRVTSTFDIKQGSFITLDGIILQKDRVQSANARHLINSTFEFAERMNKLCLSDTEMGLFCAVVVVSPDRPGLKNTDLVKMVQGELMQALKTTISENHVKNPKVYNELMELIPDLRTLSALHSHKQHEVEQEKDAAKEEFNPPSTIAYMEYFNNNDSNNNRNENIENQKLLSFNSDEHLKSSFETVDNDCSGQVKAGHKRKHVEENFYDEGICMDERVYSPEKCSYNVDSPADSGLGSAKDLGSIGSLCSSPRSDDGEKIIDEEISVLKRALQAPPLINTNLILDKAYKPHKKFRALRKNSNDAETKCDVINPSSVSNSENFTSLTPTKNILSSHSFLLQALLQGPKLTAEELKESEKIHDLIMKSDISPVYPTYNISYNVSNNLNRSHSPLSKPTAVSLQPQLHHQSKLLLPPVITNSAATPKNFPVNSHARGPVNDFILSQSQRFSPSGTSLSGSPNSNRCSIQYIPQNLHSQSISSNSSFHYNDQNISSNNTPPQRSEHQPLNLSKKNLNEL